MTQQKFFAVRIVLYLDGHTVQRDYVRGHQRMGRAAFRSWALGDFITLTNAENIQTWSVIEVDFETVRQNRLYHHTTH